VAGDAIEIEAHTNIPAPEGRASTLPRVSVVLATFNRPDLLLRVLGCLSRQTLPPGEFEAIVVDDGSNVPAT
jgi:hypothetical protein